MGESEWLQRFAHACEGVAIDGAGGIEAKAGGHELIEQGLESGELTIQRTKRDVGLVNLSPRPQTSVLRHQEKSRDSGP